MNKPITKRRMTDRQLVCAVHKGAMLVRVPGVHAGTHVWTVQTERAQHLGSSVKSSEAAWSEARRHSKLVARAERAPVLQPEEAKAGYRLTMNSKKAVMAAYPKATVCHIGRVYTIVNNGVEIGFSRKSKADAFASAYRNLMAKGDGTPAAIQPSSVTTSERTEPIQLPYGFYETNGEVQFLCDEDEDESIDLRKYDHPYAVGCHNTRHGDTTFALFRKEPLCHCAMPNGGLQAFMVTFPTIAEQMKGAILLEIPGDESEVFFAWRKGKRTFVLATSND